MRRIFSPSLSAIALTELEDIITNSGGASYAREFAPSLLNKIQVLEARGTYGPLLNPIRTAANQADLRGRLLEVNLACQFESAGIHPEVAVKQTGKGDIDFRFVVGRHEVFLETKLLREDDATRAHINAQLQKSNTFSVARSDDTQDIFRLQRDLIQKAATKKFSPAPKEGWINLVGVDVSEIQLGAVDVGDCVLAAGGNPALFQFDDFYRRSNVVGVFERANASSMTKEQIEWDSALSALTASSPHPRDYIHGAVFLFRSRKETAALVYELNSVVVWNKHLVDLSLAQELEPSIYEVIPRVRLDH
jgi:hypothetical protein